MTPALAAEIMQDLHDNVVIPFRRILDQKSSTYGVNNMEGDLKIIAKRRGYYVLGAGNFSAVVAHANHPEYAFKIGFRAEDSGAMYAAWCRDTKLPHLPEIIHMHNYPEAYMVCMPKYEDSCSGDRNIAEMHNLSGVLSNMVHGHTQCDIWCDRATWAKVVGTPLHDTLLAIHKFFNGMAHFDLHRHNWMWDKTGQVVITDPVSFKRKQIKAPSERLRDRSVSVDKRCMALLDEARANMMACAPWGNLRRPSTAERSQARNAVLGERQAPSLGWIERRMRFHTPRPVRWDEVHFPQLCPQFPGHLLNDPDGVRKDKAIDAPRGVIKNGSTLHLQALKARPHVEPSCFFIKMFNRIKGDVCEK